ncbi:IS630 family transposase [Cerasicoccus maritimus]|uniref:IS630 family transposase n=1 Tax=Cerasicoccus maritimus TaxID=490089 RepID=UPI00285268D7|nr:IS630 family transposase [Cerasicoccus maritimus]
MALVKKSGWGAAGGPVRQRVRSLSLRSEPRPAHEKRNPIKAEKFKRSFYGKLKALLIRKSLPVKVWVTDESRYGLLPSLRRVWTLKGHRPHKLWQSKYTWSYCYGALDIVDGEAVFIQTPSVNLDWTQAFLEQIKAEFPEHQHVVVRDGEGFHPSEDGHPKIPEGVHTIMLPAYSPELNPIEKLWDLIQDHTANQLWPSTETLGQVVAAHLEDWWADKRRVIKLVGNGWARASANAS